MKIAPPILLFIREETPIIQSLQQACRLSNLAKISLGVLFLTSICLRVNAQSAAVFKDSTGAIFLYGLQPNSSVEVGTVGNLVKAIRVAIPRCFSFLQGSGRLWHHERGSHPINAVY